MEHPEFEGFPEFDFHKALNGDCCGGDCNCQSDHTTPQQFADQLMESTMTALKALTTVAESNSPETVEASKAILQFSVSMTMFGAGEFHGELPEDF